MNKSIVALVTSLAVFLAGCGVSTVPVRVSEVGTSSAPSMMVAPWNGWYTLNELPDVKGAKPVAVRIVHLKKDEPLGFRTEERGVMAIAGPSDEPVPAGHYEWVMTPDAGQINPVATTIVVVLLVVVIGVGIAIAVLAINFENDWSTFSSNQGVFLRRR